MLNTGPCLSFVGAGQVGLLSCVLGSAVYVAPSVVQELRDHVEWTSKDLRTRVRDLPGSLEPGELERVERLRRWNAVLRPPHVRRLREIEYEEIEISGDYQDRLDPGESEVLAIARHRRWVAVIDEMAGHCVAEADGIANVSTLGILVQAVSAGHISLGDGEVIWDEIGRWWNRAPGGWLADYVGGQPIWPDCR